MSIAISLKINDGLVLAADSASTLIGQTPDGQIGVLNTYNNANKVFNLRKGLPIGMITWGAGSLGTASISTLAKDLRRRFSGDDPKKPDWKLNKDSYSIEEVAKQVKRFMYDENYLESFKSWSQKPDIGFIVAGYSANADMGDEYIIEVSEGKCDEPKLLRKNPDTGVTWSGMPEALSRLVMGCSPAVPHLLQQILKLPPEAVREVMSKIYGALGVPLVMPAMPLQDAIDLAEFMVDLTSKWSRFAPGPPTVAGPIELAAISKHEGFRWIKRKYYFSREQNPEETDK